MEPPKMMQNACVFDILTCKCAWRHSGVPFFHHFWTSERPKVVRTPQFFDILTLKCASRHSGVQFFHIATSKSGPNLTCFVHFDLKMRFSLQRRAIFPHRNFKKWSEPVSFLTFWLQNVLLATAACNFSVLCRATSAPAALARLLWPSRHTKHWKTQHFATSLTFRACWSSFFPHLLIFFLAALLFQLSILSEVRLLNFLRLYFISAPRSLAWFILGHQEALACLCHLMRRPTPRFHKFISKAKLHKIFFWVGRNYSQLSL